MKRIWFILIVLILQTSTASAQLYRYLNTQSGLSSQRVISIGKDLKGYMWFLSHEGIDRFNGFEFKHYYLSTEGRHIQQLSNLSKIYTDSKGNIWSIGKNGYVFEYSSQSDQFELVFNFTNKEFKQELLPLTIAQLDQNDRIWLGAQSSIYLYDIKTQQLVEIKHHMKGEVTALTQVTDDNFYIATDQEVYYTALKGNELKRLPTPGLPAITHVDMLFYHRQSKTLIINAFKYGIILYKQDTQEFHYTFLLQDIHINKITAKNLTENAVIIATNGEGIFKLNMQDKTLSSFFALNKKDAHAMKGDIISDVFIDDEHRIWMGVYPYGVTFYSGNQPTYQWLSTPPENMRSLHSNHVNQVIEDRDGDFWIATNHSVFLYNRKKDEWKDVLTPTLKKYQIKEHIFVSLCEYEPGEILAGGYMSGLFHISKKDLKVIYFPKIKPSLKKRRPDKYIRSMYSDHDTMLWIGGNFNLKGLNLKTKEIKNYAIKYPITFITSKNEKELWLGTVNGLYKFDKEKEQFGSTEQTRSIGCINTIYQPSDTVTYIGTNGSGIWIYKAATKKFTNQNTLNSILNSNNVYSILPGNCPKELIVHTEKELMVFNKQRNSLVHWTQERDLLPEKFNTAAGLHTQDGQNIFVCSQGIIQLKEPNKKNFEFNSKLILSDFTIENSLLESKEADKVIYNLDDDQQEIYLTHEQNNFSLQISSINYECPSRIQYTWTLEGYDHKWTPPGKIRWINYSHLNPGKYVLRVESVHEDYRYVIDKRSLIIHIDEPFYQSHTAFLLYLVIIIAIAALICRVLSLRQYRKISQEKIHFFIQTAHDIRTPLTLIKAPLSQIASTAQLNEDNEENLQAAIQNTDNLTRLVNQLIEFHKEDLCISKTHVTKCEIRSYVETRLKIFYIYTKKKNIQLSFECDFEQQETWIDVNKMDSILNNIISNAIKYTPHNGHITVTLKKNSNGWKISVTDTGIGISNKDLKKLFKYHFRGENAINQRITGCGIGMMQTYQLVKRHSGHIFVSSKENVGTTINLFFPYKSSRYNYLKQEVEPVPEVDAPIVNQPKITIEKREEQEKDAEKLTLLIVEDNLNLLKFLRQSLQHTYQIKEAHDGKQALDLINRSQPDMILSDVLMPILRGDELCQILKDNVTTSHIPIVLLTALDDKESQLKGLSCKADHYLVKPFDIDILKATLESIWNNRMLLRERFSRLDYHTDDLKDYVPGLDLDQDFLVQITQIIKDHLDDEFNVDHLCYELKMSRSTVFTKIKALTNQSPSEFIRVVRVNEGARLLKTHQYTVNQVADMVGYGSPRYFTEIFKKYFGVTPSIYMKEEE